VVGKPVAKGSATELQMLHRLLIEPIATLLPANPSERVIFIPQGSLFLVPFAALKSPNGKYLIEQHTLLTSPSIQVLDLTRQQKLTRQKVTNRLIVGNPTMPSLSLSPGEAPEQLAELPGAEAEARAIAQFLQAPVLTGDRATKATVKQQMSTAQVIHLATHGLLDDQRGIGSAIALAPSGDDNGLLTAEEILDLKLNADLVVLSACDTGRGKITGDGVIGLSRSLISAGAPSVIVSLWAVPDGPTAALMTQFYQNLQTNPDKAQALRQAMLTTMQQHPNPRDWAAFTLIGEAD
jgi:CHAT domain-containing protein